MACNSITLAALNSSCDNSIGGIQAVYLIPADYISGVTIGADATAETFGEVIEVGYAGAHSASDWQEFKFRKGTGSMTSNLNLDEANGVSFIETDLVMTFSKMETRKRTQMVALTKGEVVAMVKDSNGLFWYLGYNEAVTANAGLGQTGQAKTDGNYYQITLRDSAEEYPYEVSESAAAAIVAAAGKDQA